MLYFAKSTCQFYDDRIFDPGAIPSDKVQITAQQLQDLLAAQSVGQAIQGDANGNPAAVGRSIDLTVIANQKQLSLQLGGFLATINGSQYRFACDVTTAAFMASKLQRLALPDPPATIVWQLMDGSFITINAADFQPLAVKLEAFVQGTFDACASVCAEVQAGTMTTAADVDNAAVWPVNHD